MPFKGRATSRMAKVVTDEMVDALAITSTWEELPQQLLDRYGDRADEIVCYSALEYWNDDATRSTGGRTSPAASGSWQRDSRI